MGVRDEAIRLSPLPVVDLDQACVPHDGLFLRTPDVCRRNFNRGPACRDHYSRVRAAEAGQFVQCPFGFASMRLESVQVAVTSLIPFPRLGGERERDLSKKHAAHRVSLETAARATSAIARSSGALLEFERELLRKNSMALHELRKLNRSVKQTAERLCVNEAPRDPESADVNLVRIWKTADLVSHQFDVIELLANEELAGLPLNSTVELYKLFDKCVRIYRPTDPSHNITLTATPKGYSPKVRACDKTLPIIPTVLIDNALRYAQPSSDVRINLRSDGDCCRVEVENLAKSNPDLTEKIFERGVRAQKDAEGSGNGLYIAQLVARQHLTKIKLEVEKAAKEQVRCTLSLVFRTLQ